MTRWPDNGDCERTSERLELNRRNALKFLASGAAFALASCALPPEEIVPYVDIPRGLTPGLPLHFASSLPLSGFARGIVATSVEGRPIKIEGNPRHPASLGATDIFAEAMLLSLYDPDRSSVVRKGDAISNWDSFAAALWSQLAEERDRAGAGMCIVSNRITSPTLIVQIQLLLNSYPQARWYRYESIDDDAADIGAAQAFGRPLTAIPRFAEARVVLSLDADPIGPGPAQIRFSRDLFGTRKSRSPTEIPRLYCVESAWSLTGANADHRLALSPQLIRNIALTIASELGAALPAPALPAAKDFARAVAGDLKSNTGHAIVLAGRTQPPEVHAICHWINTELKAPVDYIEPVDSLPLGHAKSLQTIDEELTANEIKTLIIVGANPVYDAPGHERLGDLIDAVPFRVHFGLYQDETAQRCQWRLPMSHPLESWSDLRAFDGTAGIVQPLVRPLHDTRTAHQLLALMSGSSSASYDLVRSHWRDRSGSDDFNNWWRKTLHEGVIANSASPRLRAPRAKLPRIPPESPSSGFTMALAPDPSLWDGSFANNAWLQECPKPLTKQGMGQCAPYFRA